MSLTEEENVMLVNWRETDSPRLCEQTYDFRNTNRKSVPWHRLSLEQSVVLQIFGKIILP